uniref:Uncharacterized protein n=1 Tax=Anguilla anguilla TaxID=7936 RepID=A0A0E9WIJ1_ANGAN
MIYFTVAYCCNLQMRFQNLPVSTYITFVLNEAQTKSTPEMKMFYRRN